MSDIYEKFVGRKKKRLGWFIRKGLERGFNELLEVVGTEWVLWRKIHS